MLVLLVVVVVVVVVVVAAAKPQPLQQAESKMLLSYQTQKVVVVVVALHLLLYFALYTYISAFHMWPNVGLLTELFVIFIAQSALQIIKRSGIVNTLDACLKVLKTSSASALPHLLGRSFQAPPGGSVIWTRVRFRTRVTYKGGVYFGCHLTTAMQWFRLLDYQQERF